MKCITEIAETYETRSRPARGGWIEMIDGGKSACLSPSRPARGGWIEINP